MEKYFKNNEIDINNIEKIIIDNNVDLSIKKRLTIFGELRGLDNKIREKLRLYENITKRYENLNASIIKVKEINNLIQDIKNGIDKVAKLIKLDDVFKFYKNGLLKKIKHESQYKNKNEIFNEVTINTFTIDDFYSFLRLYLNSKDYKFSIIKRDIT